MECRASFLVVSLFLVTACISCSGEENPSREESGLRFVDDLGRVVQLDQRPQRIISLAPNITEMMYFLGEGRRLVGVTTQCDWPEAARSLAKVGDFSHPSIERIIDLSPDLVLTTSREQDRWIERITALGIPVFTIYPSDCAGLLASMRNLLALLGETRAGADSIRAFEEGLGQREAVASGEGARKPRVFIEISSSPLMTANENSFVSDVVARAGGTNIATGLERDYSIINPERVILADPDVIFIFHDLSSREEVCRRIGWERISAVKSGRVYDDVDPDLVLRPGPRVIQGIRALQERISGGN